jgi:DNA-binding MarR family transcriptional regulator
MAEQGSKPTAKPLQRLSPLIMQAFYYTRRAFDQAVRAHGITASQLGVLNRIAEHPGITGAELSRLMFTTPQAAQLMLTALERKGLVERKPDPKSGRIVRSFLTEYGRRIVHACHAAVLKVERQLSADLGTKERRTLVNLLQDYVDQLPAD